MGLLQRIAAGLKELVLLELSGWVYAIVAGIVFFATLLAGVTLLGEDPGFTVGGVSGVVFAVGALYALRTQLPYPKDHQ
ncbi:hypothetical protein EGH24_01445 [Halonotius terrestris]|uniref:Uncharacterized protein n=1 Tax=Halonotius terrestris TaxID=2487750 RepID=A0A8J8TDS9_9EURY|nr:hypothetical protein [Halonotius terrestris]TQQ83484.1 hypothetical protein EGH24_01445 [Halonotius terrestris]